MSEDEARQWPDLMAIVEAKVKPERMLLGDNSDARRRKTFWWQWGRYTPALFDAIHDLNRVLVRSIVSQWHVPAFLTAEGVFSHKLVVFAHADLSFYAVLQSRVHETWALFFGYTHEERPAYSVEDCFETFPFPALNEAVEEAGRACYAWRSEVMTRTDRGLTETYNRFHDPDERERDIVKLRELHAEIDSRSTRRCTAGRRSLSPMTFSLSTMTIRRTLAIARHLGETFNIATGGRTTCATRCWRGSSS